MWRRRPKKIKISSFNAKDADAINRILTRKGIDAVDIISIVEKTAGYYVVFYLEDDYK